MRILQFAAATVLIVCPALVAGKPPIPTPRETPVVGDWDHYLLQTLYQHEHPDSGLADIVQQKKFQNLIAKHDLKLFGGPMLGCVSDTTARFWVRTPGEANVQVVLEGHRSKLMRTSPKSDYTALLEIYGLQPATFYTYDVLVDGQSVFDKNHAFRGKQPSFRTSPSAGAQATFKVAFGGGARYNPAKEKMWDVIASYAPDALLLLGDNVYIDQPLSRTKQRVHYYRRQLRPEFQRLTASTAVYAIYDDHDLGRNDTEGGPGRFEPDWKFQSWKVFRENWNNPYYGGGATQPGCWFDFSIGSVDFFMLDNRYYRSFADGTMLGPVQKEWLLSKLRDSPATFKVIASGTLWTEHADKGGKDSWWGVQKEREEIFSLIDEERIEGVILLSADRHRTDIYQIERPNGYDLFEFETSKLTNDHTHATKKEALFSFNEGNFFGLLRFDLTRDDPTMTFQCITMEKELVYEMTLRRSELEAKAD